MKDLNRADFELIEEFIEPYRDILEDVLSSNDSHNEAERQAWRDWAEEQLTDNLLFSKKIAQEFIFKLESHYKLKNQQND